MKSSLPSPRGSCRAGIGPSIAVLSLILLMVLGNGCSASLRSIKHSQGSTLAIGHSRLITYYLADPYVQVYCYRIKLGTTDNLHFGIRSVGVANRDRAFQLVHLQSFTRDDRLRITVGPDGLLERVALRNDPKVVDSAVAVGRAVLSVAAPVPLPFKGGEDYPEFSKLVFKANYPLASLIENAEIHKEIDFTIDGFERRPSSRKLRVSALALGTTKIRDCLNQSILASLEANFSNNGADGTQSRCTDNINCADPSNKNDVIYYRPLLPFVVTIEEVDAKNTKNVISRASEVIYCPDPRKSALAQLDLPKAILAPVSLVANFSGGTLYDVSMVRYSGLVALLSAPGRLLEPYFSLPSSLFRFEVNHHGPGQAGATVVDEVGGDDKPGGNPRPIIKN